MASGWVQGACIALDWTRKGDRFIYKQSVLFSVSHLYPHFSEYEPTASSSANLLFCSNLARSVSPSTTPAQPENPPHCPATKSTTVPTLPKSYAPAGSTGRCFPRAKVSRGIRRRVTTPNGKSKRPPLHSESSSICTDRTGLLDAGEGANTIPTDLSHFDALRGSFWLSTYSRPSGPVP